MLIPVRIGVVLPQGRIPIAEPSRAVAIDEDQGARTGQMDDSAEFFVTESTWCDLRHRKRVTLLGSFVRLTLRPRWRVFEGERMSLLIERRELLDRFKRGERRALEEVYRHYAPELAAFLQRGFTFSSGGRPLRFSGYAQPFDLDNALQETFLRAFKESARVGYDGLHPYKSYLFAIARNLVLDEFRNREVAMSPFIDRLVVSGPVEVGVGKEAAPSATVADAPSAGGPTGQ